MHSGVEVAEPWPRITYPWPADLSVGEAAPRTDNGGAPIRTCPPRTNSESHTYGYAVRLPRLRQWLQDPAVAGATGETLQLGGARHSRQRDPHTRVSRQEPQRPHPRASVGRWHLSCR